MISATETFRDWMPVRFYHQGTRPFVDWCHMDDVRFMHPFFADTIRQRMREPFNQIFRHQTPIEFLDEIIDGSDVIAPTGFIFHMSRCGSTLVAQMLASVSANIVISEAPPIDSIVREHRADWLRSMIAAFGRRRFPEERNFFIKFDCWNTIDLQFIKDVFPDVPWIFLYRNPVEVIVSHMRQRGSQMVPGAMEKLIPELSFSEAMKIPAEEYCAKILSRICESALAFADDDRGLLINYEGLPDAVTGSIARHFGSDFSSKEVNQMNDAARFDAKTPRLNFEPDTQRKQIEASDAAHDAAANWVLPVYEKLESTRSKVLV